MSEKKMTISERLEEYRRYEMGETPFTPIGLTSLLEDAIAEIRRLDRDHRAMEILRERCRAGGGGGWSLWGNSLMYARVDQRKTLTTLREFYDDPADAVLAAPEADHE